MTLRARTEMSEAIAVSFAAQATRSDVQTVQRVLDALNSRNPDITSIGVRQSSGVLLASTETHASNWKPRPDGKSTLTSVSVPLGTKIGKWGDVEVTFRPLSASRLPFLSQFSPLLVTACVGFLAFCIYMVYLRFALRALNPSKVVPKRVSEALNTLAEGLLVLDRGERIVLANTSFATAAGVDGGSLVGKKVSELPWQVREIGSEQPWTRSMADGVAETGILMDLELPEQNRTYSVNSVPITDDKGQCRGVLASFEDVTEMERKNVQMSRMLDKLRKSAKQVNRQNRELERLATRDPLTNCLNRRAFFESAEQVLRAASRYAYPVSCLMLDVDHFKSVNDNHGHAMGDEVLQRVGLTLLKGSRESDLVCRYGGEEFCVLMPHIDVEGAVQIAEQLRRTIEELEFDELTVTASFGVVDEESGATDIQGMLDQADQSLYAAKNTGRNRVLHYEQLGELDLEAVAEETHVVSEIEDDDMPPEEIAIPYRAITALLSALAFRDRATAEHSRRVADLCVLLAEDLVPRRRCYVIEMAALIHDIGKVGVPDSILLKPDKLSAEEWEVMEKHDRIGTEIIRASFASDELSSIVENHHLFYGGTNGSNAPIELEIPLGARILTIADAYDAITSDRVYRAGRSQEEAFAELRRCAGTQFDPELVELFIRKLMQRQDRVGDEVGVSKEAALSIGLQIEGLVAALDDRDLKRLDVLARKMQRVAVSAGVESVVQKTQELREKLSEEQDLIDIFCTAGELLDTCRQTQSSFFDGSEFRDAVGVSPVALAESPQK